jgi:hypothetical protein
MMRHLKKHPQAANWNHFNIYSLKNYHTQAKSEVRSRKFFLAVLSLPLVTKLLNPLLTQSGTA